MKMLPLAKDLFVFVCLFFDSSELKATLGRKKEEKYNTKLAKYT